jgi:hypothetical protein
MVKKIMISALFLLLALFSLPWVAAGQSTIVNLLGGDTAEINCEGRRLVFSRESRTKVIATCRGESQAPTDTPVPEPSDTPVPEPSDTPEPEPTDPTSDIPLCPDHDPTAWHPLYDAERGCHYDHEHKGDPHQVDDIFGPVGVLYGGQEISYPWQTFSDAGTENDLKHGGYGWLVRRDQECYSANCITDFRVQFHAIMAGPGAVTRYHSFWLEARGCSEDGPSRCGIIRTGGWADYGRLLVDDVHIPLPNDPSGNNNGRRAHNTDAGKGSKDFGVWYGDNAMADVALMTNRMWGLVNPENPGELHLFCPDFQCRNNNSKMQAHVIGFRINSNLDSDGDGIVTYSGYTDRDGKIVEGCTEVGLDCVPLEIIDMPVGNYQYRDDTAGQGMGPDYDTSPEGIYWITYPN